MGQLLKICEAHQVPVTAPYTTSRLVDKLVGHFIEPQCVNPTFLCHHPLAMSPLAKQHRTRVRRDSACTVYKHRVSRGGWST